MKLKVSKLFELKFEMRPTKELKQEAKSSWLRRTGTLKWGNLCRQFLMFQFKQRFAHHWNKGMLKQPMLNLLVLPILVYQE